MDDKHVVLKNGLIMPSIGYGTWGLETGKTATESVTAALQHGYRYLDTAYSYGNDFYIGKAIKNSSIPREELFIANKVWRTFQTAPSVIDCCKKTLKLMKLSYFDLYLVHWPVPITVDGWQETNREIWQGMEQLFQEGCVHAIGVSNFLPHHLQTLNHQDLQIAPMVNQIEFHPGCFQKNILEYCQSQKIVVQGWSPLGSAGILQHDLICHFAKKYGRSPAQICLRWALQHGVVPVPRSHDPMRMADNLTVFDFELEEKDILQLDTMPDCGRSVFRPDIYHPD